MIIKVGSTTLAGADGVDTGFGPPSEVRVIQETTLQESKPIGKKRRALYGRGNAGGTLSFRIRPRFSTLALAADAAWSLSCRRGLSGALSVQPEADTTADNAALVEPETGSTPVAPTAHIQKAETRQIGLTVEVSYEIAF